MNGIKYMHFRAGADYGGVTIAYTYGYHNSILVATTVCSMRDRFCKAKGREIADTRLLNGQAEEIKIDTVREALKRTVTPFNKKAWEDVIIPTIEINQLSYNFVEKVLAEEICRSLQC